MIKGHINLYKEPKPTPTYTSNLYEHDYDHWSNDTVENEIDNAIADAMARGYCIGTKVRRKNYNRDITGTIIHFRKGAYAYKPYSGKHQILTVSWSNSNYQMNYHQDELEIVNESNQDNTCPF